MLSKRSIPEFQKFSYVSHGNYDNKVVAGADAGVGSGGGTESGSVRTIKIA